MTGQKIWEKEGKEIVQKILIVSNKNTILLKGKRGWQRVDAGTGSVIDEKIKGIKGKEVYSIWGNNLLLKGKKKMSIYNLETKKQRKVSYVPSKSQKVYDSQASIQYDTKKKRLFSTDLKRGKVAWEKTFDEIKDTIVWGENLIYIAGKKGEVFTHKEGKKVIEGLTSERDIKGLIELKDKIGLVSSSQIEYKAR